MGARVSRTDFEWKNDEDPQKLRRKIMLEKYPEIKQLFGHDPQFKWRVSLLVFIQIASLFYLHNKSWTFLIFVGYFFGGTINHILLLAQHEICHNMVFGYSRPMANRIFGIFANIPIGVPMSISFKKYHTDHHRYITDEVYDTDLPTLAEAKLFSTSFGKFCWILLQPLFYAFRPICVSPRPPEKLEIINAIFQFSCDALIVHFFGWKMLIYLICSSLICMGLHPIAGHFISEHYMFEKGFETYSYYGPLNKITWNVGYHNEHHDFPAIPGSRLPLVRKIAAEFYENLPYHTSWMKVLYDFITDPAVGPYARVKRKNLGLKY